jgi:tetratricopeptide (TPR) repeat protein
MAKSAPRENDHRAAADGPFSVEDLERAVQSDEADLDAYVRLAEAYTQADRYRDAYQVLKRALEASGGNNLAIREKLEDAQVRMVRAQVAIAEQRAAADATQEAADLLRRFRAELNRQELHVLVQRTDRYPQNLQLKYELGIRLKRDGNFQQARHAFEASRNEPDLRAAATLEMGECFQQLKQYGNAIKCYQAAATDADDGSPTHLLALYRTGVLAAALKNLETAAEAWETLLRWDPDYRDAAARLDKLKQIRDKG